MRACHESKCSIDDGEEFFDAKYVCGNVRESMHFKGASIKHKIVPKTISKEKSPKVDKRK